MVFALLFKSNINESALHLKKKQHCVAFTTWKGSDILERLQVAKVQHVFVTHGICADQEIAAMEFSGKRSM